MIKSKKIFCAFASPDLKRSSIRLYDQAKKMDFYDEIKILSLKDLNSEGQETVKGFLKKGKKRGFGYWYWKPFMILQLLKEMKENDILHYTDIGCHLIPKNLYRLKKYIDILNETQKGWLGFQYYQLDKNNNFKYPSREEFKFTKADLLAYFNVLDNAQITHTPQFWAGNFFLKKNDFSEVFLRSWLEVFEQRFDLIDNTPSKEKNFDGFIENRHDQSVYSILCKKNSIFNLSAYECDWAILNKQRTWEHAKDSPVLAIRDLKYNIFKRFFNRQKKTFNRLKKRFNF